MILTTMLQYEMLILDAREMLYYLSVSMMYFAIWDLAAEENQFEHRCEITAWVFIKFNTPLQLLFTFCNKTNGPKS